MPITHFKIQEISLSSAITCTVDGNPVVFGQSYPIALQSTVQFVRDAAYDSYYFLIPFMWILEDQINNVESNLTQGFLRYTRDFGSELPVVTDQTKTIVNNEELIFLNDNGVTDNVEYIEIDSIVGLNNWKLNNQLISKGTVIHPYQFGDFKFNALSSGGGSPYSRLNFKAFNRNGEGIKPYSVTLNLEALAKIQLLNQSNYEYSEDWGDPATTYNTIQESLNIEIYSAHINSLVNVEVVINSPFLALNAFNNIVLYDESGEIVKTANETFNISLKTNRLGVANLNIKNYIIEDAAGTKTGQITLNLVDVEGDTNLIALTDNSVVINTSLGT
jgi:hypothetical protein